MDSPQDTAKDTRAMLPSLQVAAPTFYLTGRQPLRPAAILLAIVVAAASLGAIVYAMAHSGAHLLPGGPDSSRSAGGASGDSAADDDTDDPSQIDTIVLGDPTDAPRPAHRGDHVSPVHPTILVILPHSGDHFGQIPDSPTGRLLYNWLAAFNKPDFPALATSLPTAAPASALDAQIELRRQTGGFSLLSSKEVQPGLLVFRLRDQTPAANEVLGTLWLRPDSNPPSIASFSLRAVPPPQPDPAPPTPSSR